MPIPCTAHPGSRVRTAQRAMRRGFTLIEILAVILVIALLIGILSVGFTALTSNANASATRQDLTAIRNAVTQFKSEFGFLPPLVDDAASDRVDRGATPPTIAVFDPSSRDAAAANAAATHLRDQMQDRWSEYSISYYLVGALDAAIDGVEGPGYRSPRSDGTFEVRGREYEALLDSGTGGGVEVIQRGTDLTEGDVVVVDRFGTPYRYYRWLPEPTVGSLANLNVPAVVGDPAENDELRTATFAIVSAGRDKIFDTEDDFVEVGR